MSNIREEIRLLVNNASANDAEPTDSYADQLANLFADRLEKELSKDPWNGIEECDHNPSDAFEQGVNRAIEPIQALIDELRGVQDRVQDGVQDD